MPKLAIRPLTRGFQSIGKRGFRVDQEYPKTLFFFEKQKKIIQNAKTKKHLEICQNQQYALRPEVSNPSGSVVSTMFCKAKSAKKQTFFFARGFQTIFKQKCSKMRPLLSTTFPQEFQISKNIGNPTSESVGKKTFKRYLKSEHTDKHTDGHFDLQKASAQRANAWKTCIHAAMC